MTEPCAFCLEEKELVNSHVLPAFVFRWLRKHSGSGHIRKSDNPNIRVQDGIKFPWLCEDCESTFGRYETDFSKLLFHRYKDGDSDIQYEDWLLKFCVSISWRVLKFARGRNKEARYSTTQNYLMDKAEMRWRSFINGDVPHPAEFEQHLLIFDTIDSTNVSNLPNNFNRFMASDVTLDIIGTNNSVMTFAKLGRFSIFGIIQKGDYKWRETKVHVQHGKLNNGCKTIHPQLLWFFIDRAKLSSEAFKSLSSKQRDKIDKNIIENIDSFANSGQFELLKADAKLFGENAILWDKKS